MGLFLPHCAAVATSKLRDLVVDCVCACLYSCVSKWENVCMCVYVYSSHLSTPRSICLFLPSCPSRGFCRCVQALFDASARRRAFLGATGDVYITKTLHVNSASSERKCGLLSSCWHGWSNFRSSTTETLHWLSDTAARRTRLTKFTMTIYSFDKLNTEQTGYYPPFPHVSLERVCVSSTTTTSADTMDTWMCGLTVCYQPEIRRKLSMTHFNSNTQHRNLYLKTANLSINVLVSFVLLSRKMKALLIERPAQRKWTENAG